MPVDEFRPVGEIEQVGDELAAFGLRHPFDPAGPTTDIERSPAALRVKACQWVPHVRAIALLLVGERRHVRVVHVVQAPAAEAGAPAHDRAPHVGWQLRERRVGVGEQRISLRRRNFMGIEQ
jgi:hypothetical protein